MPIHYLFRFAGIVALVMLSGCVDALIYGERTRFNLAIGVNDNAALPLSVNAGLQRTVVNYAPSVLGTGNSTGASVAKGDAVSSMSNFKLTDNTAASNLFGGQLTIATQFASGAAAVTVAKNAQAASVVTKTPPPAAPLAPAAPLIPFTPLAPPR